MQIFIHMGGITQDVKRLKFLEFYPLGFLDHLHLNCFEENYYVFYLPRSESYYVME